MELNVSPFAIIPNMLIESLIRAKIATQPVLVALDQQLLIANHV